MALKPVTCPEGFEVAVQLKVVPLSVPLRVTAVVLPPLQTDCDKEVLETPGAGLIWMVALNLVE